MYSEKMYGLIYESNGRSVDKSNSLQKMLTTDPIILKLIGLRSVYVFYIYTGLIWDI